MSEDPGIVRVAGTDRTFHRDRILVVLLIPLAMSLMAVSSINVALPTIETGLGASASDIQWVLAGYALTFGVFLIPWGRAGDVLGHGGVFVAGVAVFTFASLACGLATTPAHLNAARFVQGLGAGMFNPQTMGMIQQYFRGLARAKAFALFGMVVSVSVAIGPVLAGAIIDTIGPQNGWRVSFFLNVPLGLAGILLALRWFPFGSERGRALRKRERAAATSRGEAPPVEKARVDLDPLGAILVALAVLAIMWPFMARSGGLTWGFIPLGLLLLFGWVRWERRYRGSGREPMVDLQLFSFPSFTNGTAIAGTLFLGATSMFAVLAIFLQSGLGVSALLTGLVMLPNAIMSTYASWWAGRHVLTLGRRLIVVALAAMIAGTLLSMLVVHLVASAGWSFWWLGVTVSAVGWGMGTVGACNQTLSLEDIPSHHGGTAGGVKQTAERMGTAIGTAMVTAVFFSVAASSDWATGFMWSYVVIAGLIGLALLLAVYDLRVATRGRSRAALPRIDE